MPDTFTLYGGTAIALQLGHRSAGYFDFFGCPAMDVVVLERGLPFLAGAEVVERQQSKLTALVDRGAPVTVSFVGVPRLPRFARPLIADDNGLRVASLLDVAGTKAMLVQVRGAAQDYIDMDALIHLGGVTLASALAAARGLYGKSCNPQVTVRALSRLDDGGMHGLSDDSKRRLADAAMDVDLDHLPRLARFEDREPT